LSYTPKQLRDKKQAFFTKKEELRISFLNNLSQYFSYDASPDGTTAFTNSKP